MAKRKSTKDQQNIHIKLKTRVDLMCSGRVSSSCSTSDTRRVNLVTNPEISQQWGKDREVFTTSGTYPWSFVIQIFHSGQVSHSVVFLVFHIISKKTMWNMITLLMLMYETYVIWLTDGLGVMVLNATFNNISVIS